MPPLRRWIVAHLDTKAQAQSMAGRLVAVWVLARRRRLRSPVWRSFGCGTPLPLWSPPPVRHWPWWPGALAGRGRLRGRPAGRGTTGAASLAALACAEASDDRATGILITGAEEFGLVGARMFAADPRATVSTASTVVNLDTIDQEGDALRS